MAGRGRKLNFHGAYAEKAKARRKEHRVRGAFIRRVRIKGVIRYLVMSPRGR